LKFEKITANEDFNEKTESLKILYGGKHIHLKKYSLETKSSFLNQQLVYFDIFIILNKLSMMLFRHKLKRSKTLEMRINKFSTSIKKSSSFCDKQK